MELLTNEQLLERGTDALEKIRGGIQFSFNKFQQLQQQIRQITPQPINRALDTVAEGVEYVAEKHLLVLLNVEQQKLVQWLVKLQAVKL